MGDDELNVRATLHSAAVDQVGDCACCIENELDKAHHWYTKAIEAGSERGKERMKVFKQWLTLHKDEFPEAYEKFVKPEGESLK